MNFLRNITAALLALVIASPVCCCTTLADQTAKTNSCCSSSASTSDSGKQLPDQKPNACQCSTKQPKNTLKGIIVPTDLAVALPAPSFEVVAPIDIPQPCCVICAASQTEYDPPGALLAKYSRWLI